MLNKNISITGLAFFSLSLCSISYANSLFSTQNNHLYVPYISYQGQNYQAEFSLLNSNQLQLKTLTPRASQPTYGKSIDVDEDLNFTIQPIHLDGQLYSADISYLQGDTFNIEAISTVDQNNQQRGNLVNATLVNQVSQSQFDFFVSLYNLQASSTIDISASYDVQVYTIKYQTIDPSGMLIQASALIAFPDDMDSSFPLIAYQHGTEILKTVAPSLNPADLPTIGLAAKGYVVVSADYIGQGDSPLFHPFMHAHSLATSVIDALRAARLLSSEKGINLNGQLFLTGYSEGGYATMAAHREIQRNYSDEFSVTASAPIAGPYALLNSVTQQTTEDIPHSAAYYLPYALLAYNQVYGYREELSDFFQPPYDQTITELYDGKHSDLDINAVLPDKQQLYTTALETALDEDQNSWLKVALVENDIYRWKPNVPLYLLHCKNDHIVSFQNSQTAYDYFQSVGAKHVQLHIIDEPLLNQGEVHKNCAIPLLLQATALFDNL